MLSKSNSNSRRCSPGTEWYRSIAFFQNFWLFSRSRHTTDNVNPRARIAVFSNIEIPRVYREAITLNGCFRCDVMGRVFTPSRCDGKLLFLTNKYKFGTFFIRDWYTEHTTHLCRMVKFILNPDYTNKKPCLVHLWFNRVRWMRVQVCYLQLNYCTTGNALLTHALMCIASQNM